MFSKLTPHLLFLLGLATLASLAWQLRPAERNAPYFGISCEGSAAEDCAALLLGGDLTAEERLAARHAPIVYLPNLDRPCEPGGVSFAPVPVETVLDNPEVVLRKLSDPGFFALAPTAADLLRFGGDTYFDAYIDLPGDPSRPGCRFERDGLRFAAGHANVAYARIVEDDEGRGLVLQYWLFYYFNDWNNKHEADWELIQLHFAEDTPRQALRSEPLSVAVSAHSTGSVAAWNDSKLHREAQRPVVYVARGSHANYFKPGIYLGRGEEGRGLGCDDASRSGRRVALEARLLPNRVYGASDANAWLAFKGYWGEVVAGVTEGSTSPATKQNWLRPHTWQERLASAMVALPARSTIGPDATRAFCDAVVFGSNFVLPLYRDLPQLSLLVFAVSSIGIVAGSLARTRYLPISARPLSGRRRLGQVLTTAAEVYRRRAYVFVSLALLAFPVGLAVSSIPLVIPNPLDAELPLSYTNAARYLARALLFHGLNIAFVAVLVVAATIVVVGRMEKGQPVDAFSALGQTLRRLPGLLAARLGAALIVAGLCFTVVGIPLAVRQALRWAFLEQMILIEGKTAWQAPSASARLVAGNSGRVLLALVALGFVALCTAPIAGIALLWTFKSVPPAYINLAVSLLYALLAPYIAIAVSLVYFDLKLRRAGRD